MCGSLIILRMSDTDSTMEEELQEGEMCGNKKNVVQIVCLSAV